MDKQFNRVSGLKGELIANDFLKNNGYKILEKNYKNKIGEIDIIAKDGDYFCFVEVKFRESSIFGLPREAVNYKKQQKIKKVATLYISKNKLFDRPIRFDVIDILGNEITLIKNAF